MNISNRTESLFLLAVFLWASGLPAYSQNLIVNGDFEAGNTGFTSDYRFTRLDDGYGFGNYDVVSDPSQSHFLGASFGDYTSGTGLMLAANGSTISSDVVWRQTLSVTTNTVYQFSGWATSWASLNGQPFDPHPARLNVTINGQIVMSGFQVSNPSGSWQHFVANWDSGVASVATIELRDEVTEQSGNAITLDDLRFDSPPPPPTIDYHPQSQLGFWGKSVSFDVFVVGVEPFTYQWCMDGIPIADATNAVLTLNNLQFSDAGGYDVVVSNLYGTVFSEMAFLTINPSGVSIALHAAVTIDGVPGLTYGIQSNSDLSNTNSWVGEVNVTLSIPTQIWFDLEPASNPRKYYRVIPGPISIP